MFRVGEIFRQSPSPRISVTGLSFGPDRSLNRVQWIQVSSGYRIVPRIVPIVSSDSLTTVERTDGIGVLFAAMLGRNDEQFRC